MNAVTPNFRILSGFFLPFQAYTIKDWHHSKWEAHDAIKH